MTIEIPTPKAKTKDFIFSKYPPDNPTIFICNGANKLYKNLTHGDEVKVKITGVTELKNGKICAIRYIQEEANWIYRVNCGKFGTDWFGIADYLQA